jgi:hypothetical protein
VLLADYPSPEDQGKIYYELAHIELQSGVQRPQKGLQYVKTALELPQEFESGMRLLMYKGNCIEVSHPGVRGNELMAARREAVMPYLIALKKAREHMQKLVDNPVSPKPAAPDPSGWFADNRLRNAAAVEVATYRKELASVAEFQDLFDKQTAYLYSQMPFATDEIQRLATEVIGDQATVDRLMARVRQAVKERTDQVFEQEIEWKPPIPGNVPASRPAVASPSGPASEPVDSWTRHVQQFIINYRLDDGQQQLAWSILKELKSRGQEHRVSHKSEYDAVDKITDKKQHDRELQALDIPIYRTFEELKTRLMVIPTEAQRNAVAAGKTIAVPTDTRPAQRLPGR